jgi:alpha-glucosidase
MKKLLLVLALLFVVSSDSLAEFRFVGGVLESKRIENGIEFRLEKGLLRLQACGSNIFRVRFTNREKFDPAPSYAVVKHAPADVEFSLAEKGDCFLVSTSELSVRVSRNPCRLSFMDGEGRVLNEDEKSFGICFDGEEVRCHKTLFPDELFYGLGEKAGPLRKNGRQHLMWNSDRPGYTFKTDPLYVSVPFFIGIRNNRAYGIFLDNPFRSTFDMGASNDRFYWFGAEKGDLDYYFIRGDGIKRIISSYTELTGRMPLPPRWALGYQQSRWGYYPEATVRTLARNFRDKKIPCDVIYLDIDYMDGYRVFTWDRERFPSPEKMLSDLSALGFKVITIMDPGVKADPDYFAAREGLAKKLFAVYPDGQPYRGQVWPSWAYFPDFTKKETRDWWGDRLSVLMGQGVQGFWNDMNEPAVWGQAIPDLVRFDDQRFGADHRKIHNVYALQMARATWDGILRHYPDRRPMILSRSGFAGIQRYAAVWTGDNAADETHLKLACLMPQGMGLGGLSFAGSDAGGFIGAPSSRLYIRWMELASFTPFFRGHSAFDTPDKEPWALGPEAERHVREAIRLRYRLLPFWYGEFYRSSSSGVPVMRPMFLNFQDDPDCYAEESSLQFMIGDFLLVAPVLNERDELKKIYLPGGRWLNWWDGRVLEGGRHLVEEAPLGRIPIYMREGAVIPLEECQDYVGQKIQREMELRIFPSRGSEYVIYEDDGLSNDYRKGAYSTTVVKVERTEDSLRVAIRRLHDGYRTARNSYLLRLEDVRTFSSAAVSGRELEKVRSLDELGMKKEACFHDAASGVLLARVRDSGTLEMVCRLRDGGRLER